MKSTKVGRLLFHNCVKRVPPEGSERRTHYKVLKIMPFNKENRDVYYNPRTFRWTCEPCYYMDKYGPALMKTCSHIDACKEFEGREK